MPNFSPITSALASENGEGVQLQWNWHLHKTEPPLNAPRLTFVLDGILIESATWTSVAGASPLYLYIHECRGRTGGCRLFFSFVTLHVHWVRETHSSERPSVTTVRIAEVKASLITLLPAQLIREVSPVCCHDVQEWVCSLIREKGGKQYPPKMLIAHFDMVYRVSVTFLSRNCILRLFVSSPQEEVVDKTVHRKKTENTWHILEPKVSIKLVDFRIIEFVFSAWWHRLNYRPYRSLVLKKITSDAK